MTVRTVENETTGGKSRQIRYPNWQTILMWLVVLALVVVAIGMRLYKLGLPFDRDSYDEGVYWQSLQAMSAGHTLYSQIFYSQPPFFLLSTYPGYVLFGSTLESARLGIALVSLLGLLGAFLLGKALSGRLGAIAALLLVIVNPLYLHQSQTIQAEASAVAFSILAVGLAYLWWKHPQGLAGILWAALAGITLSLSVLCKLLSASALVPIALLLLARLWQIWHAHLLPPPKKFPETTLVSPSNLAFLRQQSATVLSDLAPILIGIGAFIVTTLVVLLPFLGSFHQMLSSVITFHSDATAILSNTPEGKALSPESNIQLIRQGLSGLLTLAALYGTGAALLRRDWLVLPLIAWLLATLYFLWRLFPLFQHHLVALAPPLIALAVIGIASPSTYTGAMNSPASFVRSPSQSSKQSQSSFLRGLLPFQPSMSNLAKITSLIAILLILITALFALRQDRQDYRTAIVRGADSLEKQEAVVATDLRNAITPDQLVVTDAQFIADLADRNTPPSLVDTSAVRIETRYLTLQQLINATSQSQVHAVLFFSGRFSLPEVASFHNWVAHHFRLLHTYGAGKELWVR